MSPATLPDGTAGKFYYQSVNAATVNPGDQLLPVTFAVTGGTPPPGLAFTPMSNGITINRIPTTPGSYQFQLTGTDTSNRTVSRNYTINIASQAITVSPVSIPPAVASVPYLVSFGATGGTPPYTYAAFNVGSQAPAALGGLLFSSNGTLSHPAGGNLVIHYSSD